jgi:hypothetical protein
MAVPRYVLIANPGTRRCELYRRELLAFWAERGVTPDLAVVPWADVVPRDGDLGGLPAFDRPALVRLESPGKDDRVTRLMLEAGARDDPGEVARNWPNPLPKGLLVRPGLWYRGFRRVLRGLRRSFDARPHLAPTACPLAVAEMFDKTATCRRLEAAGVPVPEMISSDTFPMAAGISFYHAVRGTGWPVAYIKLNAGSSAVGIVAAHFPPRMDPWGLTTLAEMDGKFYNSRRLRRVTTELGIVLCLAFLTREGAIAQRGILTARIDG